eukprot:351183-Chlamydomonas_euryale.AAC.3
MEFRLYLFNGVVQQTDCVGFTNNRQEADTPVRPPPRLLQPCGLCDLVAFVKVQWGKYGRFYSVGAIPNSHARQVTLSSHWAVGRPALRKVASIWICCQRQIAAQRLNTRVHLKVWWAVIAVRHLSAVSYTHLRAHETLMNL